MWQGRLTAVHDDLAAGQRALDDRLKALEATVATLQTDVADVTSDVKKLIVTTTLRDGAATFKINRLQADLQQLRDMLMRRSAALNVTAVDSLLKQYTLLLGDRMGDLTYYLPSDAVLDLKCTLLTSGEPKVAASVTEYVNLLDSGTIADVRVRLLEDFDAFLSSATSTMVLFGEPGSGKSMYTWYSSQSQCEALRSFLGSTDVAGAAASPWVPMWIDLKSYSRERLAGLLGTYLQSQCGLTAREVANVRLQTGAGAGIRLLVYCDGFDELQGGAGDGSFSEFYKTFSGPDVWTPDVLKVIVTSRPMSSPAEEVRVFGSSFRRRLLLPFCKSQISDYINSRVAGDAATGHRLLTADEYLAVLAS
jgi:hypothetical protein